MFELFHAKGADSEARGLATRRMHAKLAPQVCRSLAPRQFEVGPTAVRVGTSQVPYICKWTAEIRRKPDGFKSTLPGTGPLQWF